MKHASNKSPYIPYIRIFGGKETWSLALVNTLVMGCWMNDISMTVTNTKCLTSSCLYSPTAVIKMTSTALFMLLTPCNIIHTKNTPMYCVHGPLRMHHTGSSKVNFCTERPHNAFRFRWQIFVQKHGSGVDIPVCWWPRRHNLRSLAPPRPGPRQLRQHKAPSWQTRQNVGTARVTWLLCTRITAARTNKPTKPTNFTQYSYTAAQICPNHPPSPQ